MNLVFNSYLNFLKANGLKDIKVLKEGYFWLDRQIIKGFNKNTGELVKVLKIITKNDLSIEFKRYEFNKDIEFESWIETANRWKERLLILESNSLDLIRNRIEKYYDREIAVLTSGGKDSSVTLFLVEKALINSDRKVRIIFNNTTLDCGETYEFIKARNYEIISPKEGFYQWRDRMNIVPNRLTRACCSIFKEGAMVESLDKDSEFIFFMGMRNSESATRAKYLDDWKNLKWEKRKWDAVLPIREWSEIDVWLYIVLMGIDINKKYKLGYSRVGCAIACPYYTKSTWALDKYWYRYMFNRWRDILKDDFIKNKKAPILNCTLEEYYINWNGTRVRDTATPKVIKEFARMNGYTYDFAKKYFDKRCLCCNAKLKKDDIAFSMKLYGREITEYKCVKCISKELGIKQKDIKKKIKDFKSLGCTLF